MDDESRDSAIAGNLAAIRRRIAAAASRAGRAPDSVKLVAVSKTFPPEAVAEAVAAGQRVFGENKVQEAAGKIPSLPGDLEWHLIGHLQSNKIRKALPLFSWIETVDSLERARQVARVAVELGLAPKILLQVNIGRDAAKSGFAPEELARDLQSLAAVAGLDLRGLMTIPPAEDQPGEARRHFAALRELRDSLAGGGAGLPELSMGMSGDFEAAIEEGATIVRVGSSLFGTRQTSESR